MQISLFKKIIDEFYPQNKIKLFSLGGFSVIAGLFEFMGLVLIFQFILFLFNPNSNYCSIILNFFNNYLNIHDFSLISIILGCSIGLIYICKNIYMIFFLKFNNKILMDLYLFISNKIIKSFLYQDYLTISSIKPAIKNDIYSKVSIVVWQYYSRIIALITNFIIAFIILIYIFYKFTTLALVMSTLLGLLGSVTFLYLKKESIFQNKNYSIVLKECSKIISKIIYSSKEIKIQNFEDYFINQFNKNTQKLSKLNSDRNINSVLHIHLTEISIMIVFIIALIVLFFTSNFNNQIIISSISTICIVILRLTPIINRIQSSLYVINSNEKIVREILDYNSKCNFKTQKLPQEKIDFNNSIKFENVSFSYSGEKQGLSDINFEIKKGDFIGIVGKSGCYKSTLSLILTGLIFSQKGRVLIDNQELNENNVNSWQNKITLIAQEYNLLFDNILDNFTFNNHKNKKKEISEILKELDVEDILKNEDISELSQGQKQRLALAAGLYKDREILILDEITSSCDVLSEEKINNILKTIKNKKTIISIAHRLQILKHCTKILYMDNGKIIDFDTFENLDKKYSEFNKIIKLSSFKIN